MLFQTITPAKVKPAYLSQAEWDKIKRIGELRLPAITARENVKNSKGAYVIKPEAVAVEIKTGIDLSIENMDNDQLKTIVLAAGKRIGKKQITRRELVKLAARCINETAEVIDEDEEIDGDEPEVPPLA